METRAAKPARPAKARPKPTSKSKSPAGAKPKRSGKALQTVRTAASVDGFLAGLDVERHADCREVIAMMTDVAGAGPEMWGPAIIGFGKSVYRYPDGRTMDWMLAAFSPRKTDLVVYLKPDFPGKAALLKRLGKHRSGKTCLYLRRLDDVDRGVLRQLVTKSIAATRRGAK